MQKNMQQVLAGPHLSNSNHVSLLHSASRSPCSKTGVRREHALTKIEKVLTKDKSGQTSPNRDPSFEPPPIYRPLSNHCFAT